MLEPVFRRGDTYAIDPDISREDALAFWFEHQLVRVAVGDGGVAATYYLGPNHAGRGRHVANCGYAIHPDARGLGLGRALCADSLNVARREGFKAMQFNLVVSTNQAAVHLWQDFGFEIVGTVPEAFDHPHEGFIDAYVMHRRL
ncbi:MAG TPA: GNAT family N-acetyltransferase [Nitriliruptorales bacterium]|nr:GNAT family N-acetyltransferase [Nitriliruptorales bacterium]